MFRLSIILFHADIADDADKKLIPKKNLRDLCHLRETFLLLEMILLFKLGVKQKSSVVNTRDHAAFYYQKTH